MLQMFPYGWTWLDIKTPCREEMTRNLVLAANCTYARWVNKRPENAYLRKCGASMTYQEGYLHNKDGQLQYEESYVKV